MGLLCYLLGIRKPEHISRDPLVGHIFENLVILECLKARYNQGHSADLYFFRDSIGNEIDLLALNGPDIITAEIKSAQTFDMDLLRGLKRFRKNTQPTSEYLIYNGDPHALSDGTSVIHFRNAQSIFSSS